MGVVELLLARQPRVDRLLRLHVALGARGDHLGAEQEVVIEERQFRQRRADRARASGAPCRPTSAARAVTVATSTSDSSATSSRRHPGERGERSANEVLRRRAARRWRRRRRGPPGRGATHRRCRQRRHPGLWRETPEAGVLRGKIREHGAWKGRAQRTEPSRQRREGGHRPLATIRGSACRSPPPPMESRMRVSASTLRMW